MNKYGPTKENLLLALPHVLRQDANMLALADSIATVLAAQWDEIDLLRIYQRIDELDEELLDRRSWRWPRVRPSWRRISRWTGGTPTTASMSSARC